MADVSKLCNAGGITGIHWRIVRMSGTGARRAVATILAAILGLLALYASDHVVRQEMHSRNDNAIELALHSASDRLSRSLRTPVLAAENLAAFMLSGPKRLPFSEFDRFSETILKQEPVISGLGYVDSSYAVRHFYPGTASAATGGVHLLDSQIAAFAKAEPKAFRTTVSNPQRAADGAIWVIVSTPLYRRDQFRGLVVAVVDIAPMLAAATKDINPLISFQFHDTNGTLFSGDAELSSQVRTHRITVANTQWLVSAGWRGGEPGPQPFVLALIWFGGGAFVLTIVLMVARTYARQQWLAHAVAERTRDLAAETRSLENEIAEHRRTETALRESEASLRALAENANDGILVALDDGRHVFANRRIADMLGYTVAELIGTTAKDVVHPDEQEKVIARRDQRANGGVPPIQYETVFISKTGKPVPVELTAATTTWRGRKAGLIILRDNAERRRAEQALRESEERFRRLSEATSEGIFFIENGIIVETNRRGGEILGVAPEDLIGRAVRDFSDPESWPLIEQHIQAGYDKPYTAVGRRGDGTRFPVELRGQESTYRGRKVRVTVMRDVSQQVQAQEALRLSEERFYKVYHSGAAIISITRIKDGMVLDVNEAFLRAGGWTRNEVVGHTVAELKLWPMDGHREEMLEKLELSGGLHDIDMEFHNKSGEIRYCIGSIEPISIGGDSCVLVIAQNVTERKFAEKEMQKLSRALEQTADSVMITDRNGIIEYVNLSFEAVTGFSRAEAIGQTPTIVKSGKQRDSFYQKLWATIMAGHVFSEVFVNKKKDGMLYYEEKTITPLKDPQGQITHFVATGKDITERMQTQERLHFLAHHDALTELPNRIFYMDRLKESLARARWHNRRVAVLFLDLDRFKNINDTLGHAVGDRLLQLISRRFAESLREGDVVARLGGDEFAILLDDITSEKDVPGIAQKILDTLTPPFKIDEHELFVTASLGISLYPSDGEDSDTLLKHADIAMYRAKDLGKNNYQFYSADMSARAFERLTLESGLRHALERREFLLHYQPQIDTDSGKVVGVEALLRWQHPDLGIIAPTDFVPLLEETGIIIPVGEWVLRTACEQLREWKRMGRGNLRIAVNLSARQFNEPNFVAVIDRAVQAAACDPTLLELEITESIIMRHTQSTIQALDALNRMGARLAVDDFGTGYSSLSYLRRYPIDTLKIDRTFIHDIQSDADDAAITSAIIGMGQRLKINVIAEGVETREQLEFLHSNGCYVMQGHLFSKPLSSDALEKFLSENDSGLAVKA